MDNQSRSNKFEAILEEQQGVGVVVARGELDLQSAPELKGLLNQAIKQCANAGGVVADLSQVEFMESVTLGVLVEQRNELQGSGKELALVIGANDNDSEDSEEHPVGRLLNLTGQAGEFSVYDSRIVAVEDMAPKS